MAVGYDGRKKERKGGVKNSSSVKHLNLVASNV